jgi:hypothetical protein
MSFTYDNTGDGSITLKTPSGGSALFVFPSSNGSANQYLKTDGAGNMIWDDIKNAVVANSSITVADNVLFITDETDVTKRASFQVSGITSGSTRAFAFPNMDGTLALTTGAQTFQNKTIDNTNSATLKDNAFTLQDNVDITKQATFDLSGITTGQTRTYTFPDQSGTIMLVGGAQSMSGKTLDNTNIITVKDGSFTLQDDVDATKQARFQLSGIATGSTRVFTMPNDDAVLVGDDTTQTLTNKTISGLNNTFSNVPNSALTNSSVTVTAGNGLSGGGTASLGGSVTLSLPATGIAANTYGSSSAIPVIGVDVYGRVTSIGTQAVAMPANMATTDGSQTLTNKTISGLNNTFSNIPNLALTNSSVTVTAGTGLSGGGSMSLGGSVTLSLTSNSVTVSAGNGLTGGGSVSLGGSVTLSLPATGVAANTYGSGSAIPVIGVDAYGRVTSISTQGLALPANLATTDGVQTISNKTFSNYREAYVDVGISGGGLSLNAGAACNFNVWLNQNISSISISGGAGGYVTSFTLVFTADGAARSVTWPGTVKWAGGTAPTLTSTYGKKDIFSFMSLDGTNWLAVVAGQNI